MQRCLLALAAVQRIPSACPAYHAAATEAPRKCGRRLPPRFVCRGRRARRRRRPDRPPRNYDAAPYAEHDYESAQDDDGASVDVAAVDALLAERVQMKRRRLFDEADAIRDELQRVHGVSVWDRKSVENRPRRRAKPEAARPS